MMAGNIWQPTTLQFLLWTALIGVFSATCGVPYGDDTTPPPILDATHTGWQQTTCDGCHALPVENHSEDGQDRCAPCHGGNGALDPNNLDSVVFHFPDMNCLGCHGQGQGHGYTSNPGCVRCHFAQHGVDPG